MLCSTLNQSEEPVRRQTEARSSEIQIVVCSALSALNKPAQFAGGPGSSLVGAPLRGTAGRPGLHLCGRRSACPTQMVSSLPRVWGPPTRRGARARSIRGRPGGELGGEPPPPPGRVTAGRAPWPGASWNPS